MSFWCRWGDKEVSLSLSLPLFLSLSFIHTHSPAFQFSWEMLWKQLDAWLWRGLGRKRGEKVAFRGYKTGDIWRHVWYFYRSPYLRQLDWSGIYTLWSCEIFNAFLINNCHFQQHLWLQSNTVTFSCGTVNILHLLRWLVYHNFGTETRISRQEVQYQTL